VSPLVLAAVKILHSNGKEHSSTATLVFSQEWHLGFI